MAKEKKLKLLALGFDSLAPNSTLNVVTTDTANIYFNKSLDNSVSMEDFDGTIIPSGAFERIQIKSGIYGSYETINYAESEILSRERQIVNILKAGKWICFLAGEIRRTIQGSSEQTPVANTDLCKRVLNQYSIFWVERSGATVNSKSNEFHKFIHKFGVAKTALNPNGSKITKVLATMGNNESVGIEIANQIFFLPFHSPSNSDADIESAVALCSEAVLSYRMKNAVVVPEWLNDFKFTEEEEVESKLQDTLEIATQLTTQLEILRNRKAILTTSGANLVKLVLEILNDVFDVETDDDDTGKEDFKIISDKKVLAVGEIKGKNSGVTRESINQVDSHRERSGLNPETPGVLIFNDNMNIEGLEERSKRPVAEEQIKRAKNENITIIRTIDLLFLMEALQKKTSEERKVEFMNLLSKGGGQLVCDGKTYTILDK